MKNELIVRKCKSCGASCIEQDPCTCDSGCGIKCCSEKMETLEPNTFDAAVEKHVPEYDIVEDEIFVKVSPCSTITFYFFITFCIRFI